MEDVTAGELLRVHPIATLAMEEWTHDEYRRFHGELKRRVKTHTVLSSADTATLLWGLLGQITRA